MPHRNKKSPSVHTRTGASIVYTAGVSLRSLYHGKSYANIIPFINFANKIKYIVYLIGT